MAAIGPIPFDTALIGHPSKLFSGDIPLPPAPVAQVDGWRDRATPRMVAAIVPNHRAAVASQNTPQLPYAGGEPVT